MPLICQPLDLLCQVASFIEGVWLITTMAWVVSAIILSYSIFDILREMISKKITKEFAIIPAIWVGYWVYSIVTFLTLASVGIVILFSLLGFISVPTSFVLFNFIKLNFKPKKQGEFQ